MPDCHVYLVAFTLRRSNQRVLTDITAELTHGEWCHYLDDTWFVAGDETAEALADRLQRLLHPQDTLFVVELMPGAPMAGWMPRPGWDWLWERLGTKIGEETSHAQP